MRRKTIALLTLAALVPLLALAAEPIKLMVPANPGGGWDSTGRSVLAALEAEGIHKAGAQVTNKGGAGGTIGLAEFVSTMKGNDNAMMVMGVIMVGGILTNKTPVTLEQVTPLARLTIEYNAIAVAPSSPFKTVKEFADALKADPGKVPVGGGSAGGVDHITLALIGQAIKAPADKLNYVPFQGGGEMIAAVAGGKLAAAISGASEFKQYVDTGRLRLLAVSSDAKLPGISAPTLKESGLDVVVGNWRGLVGPPDMSPAGRANMVGMLDKMSKSKAWQDTLKKQGWDDAYLSGDKFSAFLKDENTRIAAVLKEVGLVK
ncbi:MAG TPA: tripartite tricarboxylate transporter substrate-binding protein [Methylomirabilota bacterium]|jgi:putative tricarboxylic transport membrane protein